MESRFDKAVRETLESIAAFEKKVKPMGNLRPDEAALQKKTIDLMTNIFSKAVIAEVMKIGSYYSTIIRLISDEKISPQDTARSVEEILPLYAAAIRTVAGFRDSHTHVFRELNEEIDAIEKKLKQMRAQKDAFDKSPAPTNKEDVGLYKDRLMQWEMSFKVSQDWLGTYNDIYNQSLHGFELIRGILKDNQTFAKGVSAWLAGDAGPLKQFIAEQKNIADAQAPNLNKTGFVAPEIILSPASETAKTNNAQQPNASVYTSSVTQFSSVKNKASKNINENCPPKGACCVIM